MPPTDPAMPPMPVMEATIRLGKLSETVANRLAIQAQCAAQAMLMMRMANHMFANPAVCVNKTANGSSAYSNIDRERALRVSIPRLIRNFGSHPPRILPSEEKVYTHNQGEGDLHFPSSPYSFFRNDGSQKQKEPPDRV